MDKILIVDAIEQNIDLISRYLTNAGYNIISATDGPSALLKARMFKPDLILLDILIPQISGFEVCKILKASDDTKYISILIITAIDSADSRNRSFEVGADDFISKSFDNALLLSKIKSLIRIKHLSDELKHRYSELQEKNDILNFQLNVAMQVQRSLIEESNFSLNNVDFISTYLPALDIGGDMYDMLRLDNSKVAVIMSDVSGHGISASLLTAMLKMMFRSTISATINPSEFLYEMNNKFCNIFTNKLIDVYACVFFAVIDTQSKEILCSNAGHTLPIFVNSKENSAQEIDIKGVPIGMLENTQYNSITLSFDNGDLLFFHTDGLGDSLYKNAYDEFLSKLKLLLISVKDMPVKQIISDVLNQFKNADESAKYEADDISIIICKM
jgi:sigma-B regulation protein RsbU (phosphoserine phosphatase)